MAKTGKVAEIKTKQTAGSVEGFISNLNDEGKRNDSLRILEMMKKATGEEPKMWGTSMIGFGNVRYKSERSGREVDWFRMGFSPRKANLTLYLTVNLQEQYAAELKKLGKHKTGVGCLYVNKLEDIDLKILKEMISKAAKRKISAT